MVHVGADLDTAKPVLRALGILARGVKQCEEGSDPHVPTKDDLRFIGGERESFGVYYQNILAVLFFKSLHKLKNLQSFYNYRLTFKRHVGLGRLLNYVVIEQRYFDLEMDHANDDHPSHDVVRGQRFVKEIYEMVRMSQQWNESAILIMYNEHGGFYDHMPTPVRGVPNPDGIVGPAPY